MHLSPNIYSYLSDIMVGAIASIVFPQQCYSTPNLFTYLWEQCLHFTDKLQTQNQLINNGICNSRLFCKCWLCAFLFVIFFCFFLYRLLNTFFFLSSFIFCCCWNKYNGRILCSWAYNSVSTDMLCNESLVSFFW